MKKNEGLGVTWGLLIRLYNGTKAELAQELGVSRVALHDLETGKHRRTPVQLLTKYAAALRRRGAAIDAAMVPSDEDFVHAWRARFGVK